MKALVQRVTRARVTVDGDEVGAIGRGLCVFVGVTGTDAASHAQRLADKLWHLRVFEDAEQKMNLSLADVGGSILIVSQFTLYGDTSKGRRPSFVDAARPEQAEPLIEDLCRQLESLGARVATGRFRADMDVEIHNDGPITLMIEV